MISPNTDPSSIEESTFSTYDVRFSKPINIAKIKVYPTDEGETKGPPFCQDIYTNMEYLKPLSSMAKKRALLSRIPLRGNTGASRPVLFLLPTTEGTKQPELIIAYEKTKANGLVSMKSKCRLGKNIHYHHFAQFH